MTDSRFEAVSKELADLLENLSADQLQTVTLSAVEWAAKRVDLVDPRAQSALRALQEGPSASSSAVRAALEEYVDELDELAWTLQDQVDRGEVSQDDQLAVFARARAACAVLDAMDENPRTAALDAVYESLIATDDLESLRLLVMAATPRDP